MAKVTTSLLVITLNVNESNTLIKKHRLAEWIKKMESHCVLSTNLTLDSSTYMHRLKMKGWEKIPCK